MLSRNPSHWRRALLALLAFVSFLPPVLLVVTANGSNSQNPQSSKPLAYFTDKAKEAGITMMNVFGGENAKKYIIETTGTGVAILDYDNDGWQDIFIVNGTKLEGFPAGKGPTTHLYHNNHHETFTDVTAKAGLA